MPRADDCKRGLSLFRNNGLNYAVLKRQVPFQTQKVRIRIFNRTSLVTLSVQTGLR